ncbi:hypothetical protein HS096_05930 [candidate division WWE3 bacterium]|uniref:Uncharacterized protein n=1 Tax=candidate division WWE3 bacterium TaxID=2053526 RepID=A0A928TVT8_UNCKA|nr:hypothetical protein [candidate division WWE3 bacterium]
MSAESHLAKFGITLQEANDFIKLNIDKPEVIFDAGVAYFVSIPMLSEITKYSESDIVQYFESSGISHPTSLNNTRKLFNSDLGALEKLVDFDNKAGVLSTASLREKVQPLIGDPDFYPSYAPFFGPSAPFQIWDGKYDPEELGVNHLGEIAATTENLESLFYGTLINTFSRLDKGELDQINHFSPDGSHDNYKILLFDDISSTPSIIAWSDEELADLVIYDAARIINAFQTSDLPGILDGSFLGLAMS